jgi:hypothetical protein
MLISEPYLVLSTYMHHICATIFLKDIYYHEFAEV